MANMITFEPKKRQSIIKVLGVGGGGSNAVNYMYRQGIEGVEFAVCNTDLQALEASPVPIKVQLGNKGGLGAGSKPEVGKSAAYESIEKLREVLNDETRMLFITAGMGGGTGTGAAPIIAEIAREMGILTVGIVTFPFLWEGRRRLQQALAGIKELREQVDTLIVISNDKLREEFGDLEVSKAFAKADDVLSLAAKGIAEIITVPGLVNIDFEDVKTVIENSGKAIMGSATAEGENRALRAIENAMNSKLLDDNDIKGARNILIYITTGNKEFKLDEITEITDYVQQECGGEYEADLIWGNGYDESLGDKIGITIIATGFEAKKEEKKPKTTLIGTLGENGLKNEPVKNEPPKTEVPVNEIHKIEPPKVELPAFKLQFNNNETEKPKAENNDDDNSLNSSKIHFGQKHEEIETETNTEPFTQPIELELSLTEKPEIIDQPVSSVTNGFSQTEKPVEETKQPEIKITLNENKNLAIKYTIESKDANPYEQFSKRESSETDENKRNASDRISKLKEQSLLNNNHDFITKMESEPAYRRKNIDITEGVPSSGTQVSRYTLGEDNYNNPVIKTDNSFLHDNVD